MVKTGFVSLKERVILESRGHLTGRGEGAGSGETEAASG